MDAGRRQPAAAQIAMEGRRALAFDRRPFWWTPGTGLMPTMNYQISSRSISKPES
jgi:hypothetical protein